jgi:hypothetical protein
MTLVLRPAAALPVGVDITALAALPPRQLHAMVQETAAIWEPYGVALIWVRSDAGTPSLPDLQDLLTIASEDSGDRLPPPAAGSRRLGAVLFLEGSEAAEKTVALSVEAVRRTIDEVPWANRRVADWPRTVREELLGRALGRVLAHEIGHYLLAWRAHTRDGLMRSGFCGDALVRPNRSAFELSDRLIPRLRARLALLAPSGSSVAEVR